MSSGASNFKAQVSGFTDRTRKRLTGAYFGIVSHTHRSIAFGSPVTGAPGQPVKTARLRNSWQVDYGTQESTITTNVPYALPIEEGVGPHGPMQVRSEVGGFHSVAMTVVGFPNIVEYERKRMRDG